MKASSLIFRALLAAEKEVTPDVIALIDARDRAADEWKNAGYPRGPFSSLDEASAAIDKNPLASALMELRVLGNRLAREEWNAEQQMKEAA